MCHQTNLEKIWKKSCYRADNTLRDLHNNSSYIRKPNPIIVLLFIQNHPDLSGSRLHLCVRRQIQNVASSRYS